jgi:inner membrane transporter RhtA
VRRVRIFFAVTATELRGPAERRGGAPLAVGLVVTAVASLQFGAGFAATLFDDLGPAGAAFLRLAVAAVVLVAMWRPRVGGRPAADLRLAALFGITLGAMNVAIYSSFDRIPLGVAVTIEFVGPLGVAVAGSRRALDGLWVICAVAGILLLADGGGSGHLDALGILYALIAGVAWAAYIVLSQRTGRVWPGASGLAVAMVVGAVLAAPLGIAQAGTALLQPGLIAAGAAVALASSVIPYSLELEALRRLPARVFGILMSLEPAVAALAGLVVLGESLAARDWLAIALVIAASAGATATAAPQAAG